MLIYNLEYKILDKIGRGKSTVHVGLFISEEDVEQAKTVLTKQMADTKIAFDVYIIDDPFLTLPK